MLTKPATTTMHSLVKSECFQYQVEDIYVPEAKKKGAIVGSCKDASFNVEVVTFEYKTKEYDMWETEYLKENQVTVMHNLKDGDCFQVNVANEYVDIAKKKGDVVGDCAASGFKVEVKKFEWTAPEGYKIPVVMYKKASKLAAEALFLV